MGWTRRWRGVDAAVAAHSEWPFGDGVSSSADLSVLDSILVHSNLQASTQAAGSTLVSVSLVHQALILTAPAAAFAHVLTVPPHRALNRAFQCGK